MKRAFDIWKQKKQGENKMSLAIRRVIHKRNLRRMDSAMQIWLRYSQELEYHCRTRILHKDFTRKAFLSHVFCEFKMQIRVAKQDRIRTLNSFYKAW